jgi:hypothetical protein
VHDESQRLTGPQLLRFRLERAIVLLVTWCGATHPEAARGTGCQPAWRTEDAAQVRPPGLRELAGAADSSRCQQSAVMKLFCIRKAYGTSCPSNLANPQYFLDTGR